MKTRSSFLFLLATFFTGWAIHVVLFRYLGTFGVLPSVLLVLTLSLGILRGSVFAETAGFMWGLSADALGTTLFGSQGLALAFIGYLAGAFRRQIDMDYPQMQIIVAVIASIVYWAGVYLLQIIFKGGASFTFVEVCLWTVFNGIACPVFHSGVRKWISLWKAG